MSLIFVSIFESCDQSGAFWKGSFSIEFCICIRVETQIFILYVQILWQIDAFQCIQWHCSVHRLLVECNNIGHCGHLMHLRIRHTMLQFLEAGREKLELFF